MQVNRVGIASAALLLAAATACRPETHLTIANQLDVPVELDDHSTGHSPDDGPPLTTIPPHQSHAMGLNFEQDRSWPWNQWPFTIGQERCAADDLYLRATTSDGREFTYGPPLCEDDIWTITP